MSPVPLSLIQVPYDLGRRAVGFGRGPLCWVEADIAGRLSAQGMAVSIERLEAPRLPAHEIGAVFELNRLLSGAVARALADGAFPLVLAGNCNSSLGTLAALGSDELGIVWFDAHGDFNTPETSISGFFDGMALAVAVGRCWRGATQALAGFAPVPESLVLLIGTRALDVAERKSLETSEVGIIEPQTIRQVGLRAVLEPALDQLAQRAASVYLHLDLDVLDPSEAAANAFAAAGGLTLAEAEEALEMIFRRFSVRAANLASYDPDYDPDATGLEAGLRLVEAVAARVAAVA